jgi:hypothetical protein
MNGNIESLRMRSKPGASVLDVFRQLVAQGRIKFNFGLVSIEPKEDDLTRVHDIIHEIDDRRVFYNAYEDELPEYMVKSIREARQAIHAERKGIWSDLWARELVQKILHDLGDFLTRTDKMRLPRNHHDPGFEEFEDLATEMRLRIWSAVAELVVAFGDAVKPMHLPKDLLEAVRAEYEENANR